MRTDRYLDTVAKIRELSSRLSRLEDVSQYDAEDETQSWSMASGFAHLEDSFRLFTDDLLPRLVGGSELADAEVLDILTDIGEEFRHIVYHIEDLRFYRYLVASPETRESQ